MSPGPAHGTPPSLRDMGDGVEDLAGGVAVRFSSLCLDTGGRLRDFPIWDTGARGALLVDLAFAGRLAQTEDSVTVDERPTGFPPADRLLGWRYAETHPAAVERDRVLQPRSPAPDWSPETAAVMAIALATGAVEPPPDPPDEALLALTGPVRWICEAVVDHLTWAHSRNRTLRATE